ncbi:ferredoxin--NADP reductase [Roseivirga thermotolerans]|uniref:Phenylacetic acid degradation protein n=1 Tax=Roseivirga thermotolerans TaxID=1758176 RepID=A0ABQ3I210_9BACT|nr:ferredoxin--NADP reductase [Roseivirga thermotolerans]GHE50541.1 phenylacetic acid degradation protein [Roseivirga thermotolerans]
MNKQIKVRRVIRETPDAITVVLEPDPWIDHYKPGQFINVSAQVLGEVISRSYSFSSTPGVDDFPAITIKRVANGRLSTQLVENLKPEMLLETSQPMGRFALKEDAEHSGGLLFIAGGSGITPLFSMIKSVLKTKPEKSIKLIYANKNEQSIIFLDQLQRLAKESSGQFEVIHLLETLASENLLGAKKGRVNAEVLVEALGDVPSFSAVYLCGPQGMMESACLSLNDLGVDPSQIYQESFSAFNTTTAPINEGVARVTIIKENGSEQITIPKNQLVLNAILNAGIELPYSCKEAMCGTCRVKLVSGKLVMNENYALTDEMLNSGFVLPCSGLAVTDELTISYL